MKNNFDRPINIKIYDDKGHDLDQEDLILLLDDTTEIIKNKLFVYKPGISFYPNFLKLDVRINKLQITLKDTDSCVSVISNGYTLEQDIEINVLNILNYIKKNYDVTDLYTQFDTDYFYDTLETIQNIGFYNLTLVDFEFCIKLIIYEIDPIMYSSIKSEISEYVNKIINTKNSISKSLFVENETYKEFLDICKTTDKFSSFIKSDVYYLSITLSADVVKKSSSGDVLNLLQIFNNFDLNETIPLVTFHRRGEQYPFVKIHDSISDNMYEKEIRSWLLNEKKKQNVVSYKKIRGLLFKHKYDENLFSTINILENGSVVAKISFDENYKETDFEKIKQNLSDSVNYIWNLLKNIPNFSNIPIFNIESNSDSIVNKEKLQIVNITTSFDTEIYIDRPSLTDMMYIPEISNYVFEVKDTISQDIMSFYYKLQTGELVEEDDFSTRGLTVNIKDNTERLNSSVITVFSSFNVDLSVLIAKKIFVLMKTGNFDKTPKNISSLRTQKVKERSNIKELRKRGVEIISTKCQKPRQPRLDSNIQPISGSYTLRYKGNNYVCPKEKYPYPGFTNDNIVCCFKKDQRTRDIYIRNIKSENEDVIVRPSNFLIDVTDNLTSESYTTQAIKIVSDYRNGFDETNSLDRYYFMSKRSSLEPIKNRAMLEKIQLAENMGIWLEPISFSKIIRQPPKNKCNFLPDLTKRSSSDMNQMCSHHIKNKYFGYNLNSYPCCFDKPKEQYILRKKKEVDLAKQHIITSDKLLEYKRLGFLPESLDRLFNNVIPRLQFSRTEYDKKKNKKGESNKDKFNKFYRIGVTQNKSSFFNSLVVANENKVINTTQLRNMITAYLNENKNVFRILNKGALLDKYKTVNNFVEKITNIDKPVVWEEMIDLLSRLLDINIVILDIPVYTETDFTSKILDEKMTRILCPKYVIYDLDKPFVILIKRERNFEPIVYLTKSGKKTEVVSTFLLNDNTSVIYKVIKFITKYISTSCIKENVYPENYYFTPLLKMNVLIDLLKNTQHKIIAQTINPRMKSDYLLTETGILLPIENDSVIEDLEQISMSKYIKSDKLLDFYEYGSGIKEINNILTKHGYKKIGILGIDLQDDYITSIFTNYGKFIPIKSTLYSDNQIELKNLTILDFKYYPEIEEVLSQEKHHLETNDQIIYTEILNNWKRTILDIKKYFGKKFIYDEYQSDKQNIVDISKNTNMSKINKIDKVSSILKRIIKGEDKNENKIIFQDLDDAFIDFVIKHISNEILQDNLNFSLLNNVIKDNFFDKDEIIVRNDENLLFNIDDLKNLFN